MKWRIWVRTPKWDHPKFTYTAFVVYPDFEQASAFVFGAECAVRAMMLAFGAAMPRRKPFMALPAVGVVL